MYCTAFYLFLIQTEGCCLIYAELKDVTQVRKKVRKMNERRKKSDELTEKKER